MKILVTGAARGLGYELCKLFLERDHVVFAGVRSAANVGELSQLAALYPQTLCICPLDVRDGQSVADCKRTVLERTSSLDVVVNNAAVLQGMNDRIADVDLSDLEETFQVNTFGPLRVIKHFVDLLRQADNPVIVNVSSEAGSVTTCGKSNYAYAMSKTALNMFSHILKKDLGDATRVYALHPGRMRTDMGRTDFPLHPRETAEAVYKLLTGQTIVDSLQWFINIYGEPMPL